MRLGKINRFLALWKRNNLISEEQEEKILNFMRQERNRQFLRLIKWLFIVGAFWLFFGFLAILKLFNLNMLRKIANFFHALNVPIVNIFKSIFGENYIFAIWGFVGVLGWVLFFGLASRLNKREKTRNVKLSYFQQTSVSGTLWIRTVSYICAGFGFSMFNRLLLPGDMSYYYAMNKIVPIFYFAGVIFFGYIAYRVFDQLALLFGIYFVALSVGCFSAYGHACYWLGVSRPALQVLVGALLIMTGFLHSYHSKQKEYKKHFARTYQWTGLLLGFISLWVMSLFGITEQGLNNGAEQWIGNILFIGAALGSMAYGARAKDILFFNYGLTFLIIETYTVLFSKLWSNLGTAFGSLFLGALMIGTGYVLKKYWLKKEFQENETLIDDMIN